MPSRRLAAAALALLVAAAACSGDDDEATEDPAPTTAAPPTTAAGPSLEATEVVEGDDVEVVADLVAFVEAARGRTFLAPPSVRLADDDAYEDVVGELLGATLEELLAEAAYLEALGLIPEGSAIQYAEAQRQQLVGSLGFFDPASGILLARGDDLDDPATRVVVLHELVHAYDHQHFSLERPGYDLDRTTERSTTFPMVVEGDAVRVEEAFLATLAPAERAAVVDAFGERPTDLDEVDDVLTFGGSAPYVLGRAFVEHLAATGGEAAVDAAVGGPPATSEQVLHPEVFDRGEGRRPVPPPEADAPVIDQGVHGELFWTTLLRFTPSDLTRAEADAAALGWGGDAYVSWLDGDGRTCTRSDVEGDTPADTAELVGALVVWVEATPEGTVETTPEGRARVQVCYQVPVAPTGNPSR